jgi:predicted esterase/catechol 2,3-dioxygenase-like lactoylglutathione lyase family enzyme
MEPFALSIPHLVRPPKVNLRHAPLLLLMHGQESSEKDVFGIATTLDDRFLVVCPRGPFNRFAGRNNWFQAELVSGSWMTNSIQAEYSRQALIKFLHEVVDTYQTNPSQTYLMGFCQGAVMALDLMLSEHSKYAGVVAMSGQLLPEMRTTPAKPEGLQGFPVMVTHGVNDDIYPIGCGRIIRDTLTNWGMNLRYREYPGGHLLTQESLVDVRTWLTAQLDDKGIVATPAALDYQLKLGHLLLKVRNLERSIAFYTRFLGLRLVERTGNTYAFLSSGDAHHDIALQNVGPNAPIPPSHSTGLGNVAFHVPDPQSFARAYKGLREASIPASLVDHQISWGISFTDPDGNGIEIYCDTRHLPGHSNLWQGRDLPLDPDKVLALLEETP